MANNDDYRGFYTECLLYPLKEEEEEDGDNEEPQPQNKSQEEIQIMLTTSNFASNQTTTQNTETTHIHEDNKIPSTKGTHSSEIKTKKTHHEKPKVQVQVQENNKLKVLLVGDEGVGKTSLIITYVSNVFPTGEYEAIPNIYDDFTAQLIYKDSHIVELTICDSTAQLEDKSRFGKYTEVNVIIICFSIISRSSFKNRKRWITELQKYCPSIPFIYVATKIDVLHNNLINNNNNNNKNNNSSEAINEMEIQRAAKKEGAHGCVLCSSLEIVNLKNVFDVALDAAFAPPRTSSVLSTLKSLLF